MPLRQNESSKQATSAFKNLQTFIKQKFIRRTQVATDESIKLLPEFIFKGTAKRPPRVDLPDGIHYQWAQKGSYRL